MSLNLAQMRDQIRRMLQIVPPIDIEGGAAGVAPANRPNPNNQTINDAINRALALLNQESHNHEDWESTVALTAQTGNGPLYIDQNSITVGGVSGKMSISQIKRVAWNDGTTITRLIPTSFEELDARNSQFDNMPPAVPNRYFIVGGQLAILPAPNIPGNLNIIAGYAFATLTNDTDTVDEIPTDLQIYIPYGAVCELSRMMTMDTEAANRLQNFQPLFTEGIRLWAEYRQTRDGEYQPSFKLRSYRRGYLRRKVSTY